MFNPACSSTGEVPDQGADSRDSANSLLPLKEEVFGVARIEPEKEIVSLNAGASGKILEVLVKANQMVEQNQEVIRLDQALELAQLAQAKSRMIRQKADEAVAIANLEQAKLDFKQAERDLQLAEDLLAGNAETRETVIERQEQLDRRKQQIAIMEASLKQTKANQSDIESAIAYYQTLLSQKRVMAPLAGQILNVMVNPGEYVTNATIILEYAPAGGVIANTEVDEFFAEAIKEGQRAVIYSQLTGKELARGSVIFAAQYLSQKSLFKNQSTELEDRRVREVKVLLDEGTIPIYGSRVDCRIFLKS